MGNVFLRIVTNEGKNKKKILNFLLTLLNCFCKGLNSVVWFLSVNFRSQRVSVPEEWTQLDNKYRGYITHQGYKLENCLECGMVFPFCKLIILCNTFRFRF